jgi:hypothetical protein
MSIGLPKPSGQEVLMVDVRRIDPGRRNGVWPKGFLGGVSVSCMVQVTFKGAGC